MTKVTMTGISEWYIDNKYIDIGNNYSITYIKNREKEIVINFEEDKNSANKTYKKIHFIFKNGSLYELDSSSFFGNELKLSRLGFGYSYENNLYLLENRFELQDLYDNSFIGKFMISLVMKNGIDFIFEATAFECWVE